MQNPEGYEDDISTLGDESMIRRAARSLWGGGTGTGTPLDAPTKGRSSKQQKHQISYPSEMKEIRIDKSKSRTGNTAIQNYFSYSNDDNNDNNDDEENAESPKSVDVYTTVGDEPTNDKMVVGTGASVVSADRSTNFIQQNKWLIIKFMVGLATFLLAVATVALTFSLLHINDHTDTSSNGDLSSDFFGGSFPPALAPPTGVTTPSDPGSSPNSSPTDPPEIIDEIKLDLLTLITNHTSATAESVVDAQTPQAQAYEWLANDPSYWTYKNETILQRWVLAVLFYSTGGPDWENENFPVTFGLGKTPWLSYTDECQWESTNKGSNGRICDDNGEIFALHLQNIGLNGTIPTEIGLLTRLRLLFVDENVGLGGSIPTELGKLTRLEKVRLS